MAPQEERITYYEQAEQQWEHDQAHTRAAHYRQSLFEGSPDLSVVDENREAFERARQGQGPLTPQDFEPFPFHPSEAVHVVVEDAIESGKASETFPPSWAHEHGRFDEPPDVEHVVFINREQKRYGI
jgi:hypothetical protein